jgi:ABC-type multidrug transport system ATPase subunit/ABC-type multidrug transport system permease subunit
VISCRKDDGSIYGSVSVDGISLTSGSRSQRSRKVEWINTAAAYVKQDDCHLAQLTVRETLAYAARLRMSGASVAAEDVARVVDATMATLGIQHVADSPVGDSLNRGISGGQLKRLSIGVETVTSPSIIFLDEPTSGLDSAIALEVMTAVKALVASGRTVVCTIHQPSFETFELFTDLLLLSAGRVVYAGPSRQATPYFESLGYVYDGVSNPADFIIEVAGGMACPGSHDDLEKSFGMSHVKTPSQLAELFRQSPQHAATAAILDALPPASITSPPPRSQSFSRTFATILSRSALANARNTSYTRAQILKNIIVGAIAGCIFYGQGKMDSSVFDVQGNLPEAAGYNVVSILYFALLYATTGNLQAIPQICEAKVLFLRERAAGAYTTFPFFMANTIVYLPLIIFTHFFFTNLTYWLVQLPSNIEIASYMFVTTLLVNIISFYFSQLLAFSCSSSQVALALFPILFMFLSNFAGFTIQLNNINEGWSWAPYISFPRWALEGLVYVTFTTKKPPNYEELLDFYQFPAKGGEWNGLWSIYILLPYMLFVNLLVLWAMQPEKSGIRIFNSKREDPRIGAGGSSRQNSRNSSTGGAMDDLVGGTSSISGTASSITGRSTTFAAIGSNNRAFIDEDAVILEEEEVESGDSDEERTGSKHGSDDLRSPLIERSSSSKSSSRPPSILKAPSPSKIGKQLPIGNPAERRGSWSVEDFRRNSSGVGMLASRGLNVSFRDLRYDVVAPKNAQANSEGMLQILRGAHGRAQAGEMVALMGASGAGKSTLLDVLAGRKTLGKYAVLNGELSFNGKPRERKIMRRSAYVTQDNVHLESITVRQTLGFAAALRMEGATAEKRAVRVNDVAKMLGLDGILDSQVGGQLIRGISGGQLKRLSIAVEIISLPELIFLVRCSEPFLFSLRSVAPY